MNATHDQAKSIFLAAADIASPEERRAFVEAECAGDKSLRSEVDALLRHQESLGSFLESPAIGVTAEHTALFAERLAERPGTVIGPYKLLQQIGEGGFGVVFLAEQTSPVRRKVALKIIKPGMDTREVIARFEAERQAVAMMDHPNIAKVFDAGVTESGRPYFVMEVVAGVSITEFCNECGLSTRERLELFITVCQAVQHAHQKGVIHRDIKPTNLLVTVQDGRAAPKIIDFGVAKATNQRLTERTLTAFAQMVGTPLYMSPEQAELSPLGVDTRSDVYSLGVLLYELLTGTTPYDKDRLHAAPHDELRRIIREEEPPRPSARISTLAADMATTVAERRRTDSRRLFLAVRGDLDWIVMKALEKDRNRRYETAAALAADVRHYLADEPVTAGPPSRLYRANKFVKRNRGLVLASAAVLAGLIAGIIGTSTGLVSQSRQRTIAERERAEAQLNLASVLHSQRKYLEAESLYRQGLAIPSGDVTPEDRRRSARTRLRLAQVVGEKGDAAKAERLHREALAAFRADYPTGDPSIAHALTELALVLRSQRRFADAEPLFREAYEINRRAAPADHFATGVSATHLGNVLITLGRHVEAEPIVRMGVAELQLAVPRDEWALALAQLELGRVLIAMGRFPEAESQLLKAEVVLTSTDHFRYGAMALAALYTTWHKSEPGKGYDAKAHEWYGKLIGTYVRP